jgi:hypothetical protein
MSFDKLLKKVEQAESTLEAQERRMSADWRQLKRSWKASWTPGRIVAAGLVSGYLVGRTEPLQKATNAGVSVARLLASALALKASDQAHAAAQDAEGAAQDAEDTALRSAAAVGARPTARATHGNDPPPTQPTATAEAYEP